MMNSNFVGCSTGRSAGLAPLRILSTYVAPVQVGYARAVGHQAPVFYILALRIHRRPAVLCREVSKLCSPRIEDGALQHQDCVSTAFSRSLECGLNILGIQ